MIQRDHLPAIGLGLGQIMGYGTLYYAYAILLPHMARDLGLSLSQVFGVLSAGLFIGGFLAPVAGRLTDRYGGRLVMTLGSALAGGAVILLGRVTGPLDLLATVIVAEAASMFVLYPVAFAAIARLDLTIPAQRSISIITLFGGIASTIFWPLTLALYNSFDWRLSWVLLGVAYVLICVPLHYLSLGGPEHAPDKPRAATSDWPELTGAARKRGMLWMVISFVFASYLMGAMMTLWVTNAQDLGHSAAMAALAGAVIGPFKTVGRFFEMIVSRNLYPRVTYALALGLMMAGFAVLLSVGFTVPGVMLAAALYGMGDGIKTIASGTLPLALFGHKGYGARLGWINLVRMGVNASAPFVFAFVTQTFGGWWSFMAMAVILACACATYFLIPNPRRPDHGPTENRRLPENL